MSAFDPDPNFCGATARYFESWGYATFHYCYVVAAPNGRPAALVISIASAPHATTRAAPRRIEAPPVLAANAPRAARDTIDTPALSGILNPWGVDKAAMNGMPPPTAKLNVEVMEA